MLLVKLHLGLVCKNITQVKLLLEIAINELGGFDEFQFDKLNITNVLFYFV